jgi:hypothetical protein
MNNRASATDNTFDGVISWAGSHLIMWVFLVGIGLFLSGAVLLVEDVYSSRIGIDWLEQNFNLNAVHWSGTYWVMSIVISLGQIGFGYTYLSDKSQKWAIAVVAVLFVVDFGADVFWRMDRLVTLDLRGAIASALTIGYFSIGSELFITLGIGITLASFAPAYEQYARIGIRLAEAQRRVKDMRKKARDSRVAASNGGEPIGDMRPQRHPQQQQRQQQHNGRQPQGERGR